jgi:tRNA(fMet)-specific endonuclease VapC
VTYLLDTDHITLLLRSSGSEHERLRDRIDARGTFEFGMSVVSFHEQLMGCNSYIARNRRLEILKGYDLMYCPAHIVTFEDSAMAQFEKLRRDGIRIGTMDLRIAAIALANDLTLLTRNAIDFSKVPGLLIEDWTTT